MDYRHPIASSSTIRPFADRHEAGVELASLLLKYRGRNDVLVLALPRGGVPVAVRAQAPARIVVAVPVGAPDTCTGFAGIADETICARTPERFSAVGLWYIDFSQTTDDEVRALLQRRAAATASGTRS